MNTSENTSEDLLDILSIAGTLVHLEHRQIVRAEGFGRRTLIALRAIDAGRATELPRIDRLRERGLIQAGAAGVELTALGAETLDRVNTALAGLEARVAAALTDADALRSLVADLGGAARIVAARQERARFGHRFGGAHGHGREFGHGHRHGHGRGHGHPSRESFGHDRPARDERRGDAGHRDGGHRRPGFPGSREAGMGHRFGR